jgi:ubiquinone/menaquinone biosynthesis C-methylase UbiE
MADAQKSPVEHFSLLASTYEAATGGCTRELTQYFLPLLPPFSATSTVLDNACGNGIVAQEILRANPNTPLHMTCIDATPSMVEMARHTLPETQSAATLTFEVMPGEALKFPDESFSHSITNQGILFFADGEKGASEIYRTLQSAGTAIVTCWKYLGYLPVIHAAQKRVKPQSTPFRIPVKEEWFEDGYLRDMLVGTGFGHVEVSERTVWYAAGSVEEACGHLKRLFGKMEGWSEEDSEALGRELVKEAESVVQRIVRDGREMVGFEMVAFVAVARK